MRLIVGASCAVVLATMTHLHAVDGPSACADVTKLALPHAKITQAEAVQAGVYKPPIQGADPRSLPAFCRGAMTLTPSPDSDIKVELWIPTATWNGKFQAVGNGAFNGTIAYAAMESALTRGYATSSTDTGHTGGGASWALGHPEKVVDFGWRAVPRRGTEHVRRRGRAGAVGGARRSPGSHRRVTRDKRPRRPHAFSLSLPAGRG